MVHVRLLVRRCSATRRHTRRHPTPRRGAAPRSNAAHPPPTTHHHPRTITNHQHHSPAHSPIHSFITHTRSLPTFLLPLPAALLHKLLMFPDRMTVGFQNLLLAYFTSHHDLHPSAPSRSLLICSEAKRQRCDGEAATAASAGLTDAMQAEWESLAQALRE